MIQIIKPVKHVINILEKCLNVKDVIVIILALTEHVIIGHINVVSVSLLL